MFSNKRGFVMIHVVILLLLVPIVLSVYFHQMMLIQRSQEYKHNNNIYIKEIHQRVYKGTKEDFEFKDEVGNLYDVKVQVKQICDNTNCSSYIDSNGNVLPNVKYTVKVYKNEYLISETDFNKVEGLL